MRLETFVGLPRRPKILSFWRVRAWCRAQCGDSQALDATWKAAGACERYLRWPGREELQEWAREGEADSLITSWM